MMVHTHNNCVQEAEEGMSQDHSQSGLYKKTLSQTNNNNKIIIPTFFLAQLIITPQQVHFIPLGSLECLFSPDSITEVKS